MTLNFLFDAMLIMGLLFLGLWALILGILFVIDLRDDSVVERKQTQQNRIAGSARGLTAA